MPTIIERPRPISQSISGERPVNKAYLFGAAKPQNALFLEFIKIL